MMKSRLLISLVLTLPVLPVSAEVTVPHVFSRGQKAVAAEVNANFTSTTNAINTNSADISIIKSDITSINARLGGEGTGIPGPAGPPGPPGASAGNSAQLSKTAILLKETELASQFPSYAIDGQTCSSKTSISASVILGGLSMPVTGLLGTESLSKTFRFSVTGVSSTKLDSNTLVGSTASLNINTAAGSRTISGIATRVGTSYSANGDTLYVLTIEPALSQLALANDYKIYQSMTAPDMIQEIFNSYGVNTSLSLSASYPMRDMQVMYDQSPLSYIQRVSQENGIAYLFNGGSTLFIDNAAAYINSGLSLNFFGLDGAVSQDAAYALSFFTAGAQSAGKYTVDSYNFETPNTSLSSTQGGGTIEKYSFDTGYRDSFETQAAAQTGLAKSTATAMQHYGTSNSPLISAGYTFNLNGIGSASPLSGNYVATTVKHALSKSADGSCLVYANSFSSKAASSFSPPAVTAAKSKVNGSITATVTGPFGETLYTDDYGRVKVQFHWDRDGGNDEFSSAWVRVATPVNRLQDKHLYIPKIGSEVLVDFLNGDPSQPIITGSLYNANHMPPLQLPLKKAAAENSPYNDYDYFSYTVGGESGTTTQSVFETKKTILSLANNGTCVFTTDDTYRLTQRATGTNTTTIQHNEAFSINKLMPGCNFVAVSGNTISLLVDGTPVVLKMDADWNNGSAIVNPPDNGAPSRRISFVRVVKKLSAPASDLP